MKKTKQDRIPEAVIRRLPKYYRYLGELEAKGEQRISSAQMSKDTGFNASQIRRDLNCFGGFGQQGYGYSVSTLKSAIAAILGLNRVYKAIVIGAGNIGQALIKYTKFQEKGFQLIAMFDVNPELIGHTIGDSMVYHMDELDNFTAEHKIDIGIICTPKEVAQQVADNLVSHGINAIWNFAPIDVLVRKGVSVENVYLNDSLYVLCYRANAQYRERK